MLRAIAMFSGGKDSTYALHTALLQGFEIEALVTLRPVLTHPWYVHSPFTEYTRLQAKLMSMENKHIMLLLKARTKDEERAEIKKMIEDLYTKLNFDYIVLGVLASDAQRSLFLDIADSIGVKLYTPLWGRDPAQHLIDVISSGFEFIITSVNAWGLPVNFLGRVVDMEMAMKIIELSKRFSFNPSFEGGEAETFVVYTPLFRDKRICVDYELNIVSDYEGYVKPKNVYVC